MWKIALGVALGIVLAGIITTGGWMLFVGAVLSSIGDAFQQSQQQLTSNKPLKITPIGTNVEQNQPINTSSTLPTDSVLRYLQIRFELG